MKRSLLFIYFILLTVSTRATDTPAPANFVKGDAGVASISTMTFNEEGILFIGDSKNAEVIALQLDEESAPSWQEDLSIKNIDQVLSALMGTTADKIMIQDMAIQPKTGTIYFGIHHQDGTPALVRMVPGQQPEWIPLDDVMFTKKSIRNVVSPDDKDRRGRSLRQWTVTDMVFSDGKLYLTGLSNKEFSSTFRAMPFPFTDSQEDASLEIYHAAHGQFETQAPIRTFSIVSMDGQPYVVASYTCTPLVVFPLTEMKSGQHAKGRTVAEMGSGNQPLDMVILDGKENQILMMANSNRPVMKVNLRDVREYSGTLTAQVEIPGATAGVPYISLPETNVLQMDKYGDTILILQRQNNGDLNLATVNKFWLQG